MIVSYQFNSLETLQMLWPCFEDIYVQWSRISNSEDIVNFVCTPPCSRIALTVAMDIMCVCVFFFFFFFLFLFFL